MPNHNFYHTILAKESFAHLLDFLHITTSTPLQLRHYQRICNEIVLQYIFVTETNSYFTITAYQVKEIQFLLLLLLLLLLPSTLPLLSHCCCCVCVFFHFRSIYFHLVKRMFLHLVRTFFGTKCHLKGNKKLQNIEWLTAFDVI